MFYTNGKFIIESEGDTEALEEAIEKLIEHLKGKFPSAYFEFVEEPFVHYLIPEYIQYEDLKGVLGPELKRRAINEDTLDLPEEVTKEVKHYYSFDELEQKADELVNSIKRRDEIETEKKAYVHNLNEKLKEIETLISTLAQQRREKYEIQKVVCKKQISFSDQKVYFIADEEILITEDMTPADRQLLISFDGSPVIEGTPFINVEAGGLSPEALQVNLDKEEQKEPEPTI